MVVAILSTLTLSGKAFFSVQTMCLYLCYFATGYSDPYNSSKDLRWDEYTQQLRIFSLIP